ncbi:MAG TPA: transposase [Actinocrinis sp.]|uniref:transposase n=1 Tax=Actinocrinis sp. TaxID=1920516 RepID=UPI002DDD8B21|nr:transposase [Actinocrinis sp.]HEV3172308.1 transposase [Actinocrinis sp.]
MPKTRGHYNADFKVGAVRLGEETGNSIAQVARAGDQRHHAGLLGVRREVGAAPAGLSTAERA